MTNIKTELEDLLQRAWLHLQQTNNIKIADTANKIAIQAEPVKPSRRALGHGDFASNFALIAARYTNVDAKVLAQHLISIMQTQIAEQRIDHVVKVEAAGPGFINFFIDQQKQQCNLLASIVQDQSFFMINPAHKKSVLVEYVSANPTGPLHVGHGRGAAYGATLVNLLRAAGHMVQSEYYVNDAGRQMDILAFSVWLRYLAMHDATLAKHFRTHFLPNAYRGDYIFPIAQGLQEKYKDDLAITTPSLLQLIYQESSPSEHAENQESFLDQCIATAKSVLKDQFGKIAHFALHKIQADIQDDLADFGVHFDHWFSEQSLYTPDHDGHNAIDRLMNELRTAGLTYEQAGALWFRASRFGDTEDRVLRRDNGIYTYFAADIAYHHHKLSRGQDQIINIWGADHHGYAPRIRAALRALGYPDEKLQIILVQFAALYRNQQRISMSTRAGQFVTLRTLREETGNDAARLFYLLRRSEQHMEFDLDLAKARTKDNPVYYLQYAYARIQSIFSNATQQKQLRYDPDLALTHTHALQEKEEKHLMMALYGYQNIISKAAEKLDPLLLINYLRQLATDFHTYYNAIRILPDSATVKETALFQARLLLCDAIARVLHHGLTILGIHAPDRMEHTDTNTAVN